MKKTTLIISLLLGFFSFSQNKKTNNFSISISTNYPISIGNNFLNKAYDDRIGLGLEAQYLINKIFFGVNYKYGNEAISNPNLMGGIKSSNNNQTYYFIGYKQKLTSNKMFLEHRIGAGDKSINNKTNINDYQITGKSWILGSKFNYLIDKNLCVFGSLEYHFSSYNVNIDGPYHDFYTKSHQIIPAVGIKIQF
jgi:hypothetical protein